MTEDERRELAGMIALTAEDERRELSRVIALTLRMIAAFVKRGHSIEDALGVAADGIEAAAANSPAASDRP